MELVKTKKEQSQQPPKIILVGNPNVGKSVIFNKLTGINQKVANFPGITLTYLRGKLSSHSDAELIDLPGVYSLTSLKAEERLTHQFLIQERPDLVINVIDGRKLERNLALTLQLLEFEIPMLLVITFKDKINNAGISFSKLQNILEVPVVAIDSHKSKDYYPVKEKINKLLDQTQEMDYKPDYQKVKIPEIDKMLHKMETIEEKPLFLNSQESTIEDLPNRLLLLSSVLSGTDTLHTLPTYLLSRINSILSEYYPTNKDRYKLQLSIVQKYYNRSEEIVSEIITSEYQIKNQSLLKKIDTVLTHPVYGLLIFVGLMFTMFSLTFILTEPLVVGLETVMENLATFIKTTIANDLLASFLADGIIGGVGFVLVFIPQIAVLFIFIALLEHSGYLARAVFITDMYLEKIGISGTSIAPLLLGFGCNVPGVMATKSISDNNERIAVGLVNPFMSCSARLPVYMIIASAIFPSSVGLVVTSLYFIGIIIAVVLMYVLRNTILPGESQYLILELPDLHIPKLDAMTKEAYRHSKKFVENAASWMAIGLIIIWALSITGPSGYIGTEALEDTVLMKKSWVYFVGELLSPIFSPLGWDPRLIVALFLGFIAKEIVIGSLGLLYGVASQNLEVVLLTTFTPVSAYAFMVFVLIYTPCIGTYFTMRSNLGKKWANLSVVLSLLLAYVLALLTTFLGNLIFV